jgi:hypothetical protein
MAMSQEELQAIISGQATLDDVIAARQAAEAEMAGPYGGLPPQAQEYLARFGQDFMPQAMEMFQQAGGPLQNEKYWNDDIYKWYDQLADRAVAEGKAGYQTFLDTEKLGLAQAEGDRQAAEFEAKYSTPEADWRALEMQGVTPELFRQAIESGNEEALAEIAGGLGMKNDMDEPDWRTPEGIRRLTALEQYHDNLAAEQAEQAGQLSERERWGAMDPESRAKETYMSLYGNEAEPFAVGAQGAVFRGEGASDQARRSVMAPPTTWSTLDQMRPKRPRMTFGGAGRTDPGAKKDWIDTWFNDKPREVWDWAAAGPVKWLRGQHEGSIAGDMYWPGRDNEPPKRTSQPKQKDKNKKNKNAWVSAQSWLERNVGGR